MSFNSRLQLLHFFVPASLKSCCPQPLVLRLAGLGLIWSAWCSAAGWLLSWLHLLSAPGYLLMFPVLVGGAVLWWRTTAPPEQCRLFKWAKYRRRFRRVAPAIWLVTAGLALLGGALYAPWSFDAASYRLPRILYWWFAGQWHWIDTLDHRLDFSSAGFEWQMLPLIIFSRSDRLLFLLNWIPFLMLPGLIFLAFRALGVNGRGARRWMWLLPSAFCIALQAGSVQNDGYSLLYLLAAVIFARQAAGGGWLVLGMALLGVSLLTGAKVSNLPLLLPLGVCLLPALARIRKLNWHLLWLLPVLILCSFAPLSFYSWLHTGDWAGDPTDQWHVKTKGPAGGLGANVLLLARDVSQPPLFPGSSRINQALEPFNQSTMADWLRQGHGEFIKLRYGDMVYEGSAGLGFGVALYLVFLVSASGWLKKRPEPPNPDLPLIWRLAPWLAWISYLVFLVKLGSDHSPRIAAPYYPLLLVTLLRLPHIAAAERCKAAGVVAVWAAAMVLPVMILTPARPLFPIAKLAEVTRHPALTKLAAKYGFWAGLRDDLAPLRAQIPAEATRLGYAAGFHDTPYALCQPLSRRQVIELGLPVGRGTPPPPDLTYAVVTERGIRERYRQPLTEWLTAAGGRIIFTYPRNVMLDAQSPPQYESWHLVKFDQPKAD